METVWVLSLLLPEGRVQCPCCLALQESSSPTLVSQALSLAVPSPPPSPLQVQAHAERESQARDTGESCTHFSIP